MVVCEKFYGIFWTGVGAYTQIQVMCHLLGSQNFSCL